MAYGAGTVAARRFGAREIVDPRPYAVGSIRDAYAQYPATGPLLPAMGYGDEQIEELEATINNTPCDLVLVATPIDLRRLIDIEKPSDRVRYELEEISHPNLEEIIRGRFG
jgi:predicted GTPase